MFFIPHKGKWYRWAINTSPLKRYALTATILIICSVFWVYVSVWLRSAIVMEQVAIADINQCAFSCKTAQQDITTCTASCTNIKQQCDALVCRSFPFVAVLEKLRMYHIAVIQYQEEGNKHKRGYTQGLIELVTEGSLDAHMQFLSFLSTNILTIQCEKIDFQRTAPQLFSVRYSLSYVMCHTIT